MEKSYRRIVVYLGLKCKYAKVLHQKMKQTQPHNFQTSDRILTKSNAIASAATERSYSLCWRIMSACAISHCSQSDFAI